MFGEPQVLCAHFQVWRFWSFSQKYGWDRYRLPVGWSGEYGQDDVPAVHPDDGTDGVKQVKVEMGITRDRAVQTGLQERCPLLLQNTLRTTLVTLTHPSHTWHHHLWETRHGEANEVKAKLEYDAFTTVRQSNLYEHCSQITSMINWGVIDIYTIFSRL